MHLGKSITSTIECTKNDLRLHSAKLRVRTDSLLYVLRQFYRRHVVISTLIVLLLTIPPSFYYLPPYVQIILDT